MNTKTPQKLTVFEVFSIFAERGGALSNPNQKDLEAIHQLFEELKQNNQLRKIVLKKEEIEL